MARMVSTHVSAQKGKLNEGDDNIYFLVVLVSFQSLARFFKLFSIYIWLSKSCAKVELCLKTRSPAPFRTVLSCCQASPHTVLSSVLHEPFILDRSVSDWLPSIYVAALSCSPDVLKSCCPAVLKSYRTWVPSPRVTRPIRICPALARSYFSYDIGTGTVNPERMIPGEIVPEVLDPKVMFVSEISLNYWTCINDQFLNCWPLFTENKSGHCFIFRVLVSFSLNI